MKKHGIKHRSLVHLSGKKNLKVGGSCGANHDQPKRGGSKYSAKKQMRASLKGRQRSSKKRAGALRSSRKSQKASLSRRSSRKSAGSMHKSSRAARQQKASLQRSARQQQRQQMGGDFWSFFN